MRDIDFLPDTCPHLAGVGAIITDEGLAHHHDIRLVRAASGKSRSGASFERDSSRALALMSLAAGHPVSMRALDHIEAAASHWQRGDRALANLRLAFAGLPRLIGDTTADRLRLRPISSTRAWRRRN